MKALMIETKGRSQDRLKFLRFDCRVLRERGT